MTLALLLAAGSTIALTLPRRAYAAPAEPAVKAEAPAASPAAKALFDQALAHAPKGPDALVSLALTDADAAELVRVVSEMTGRRFALAAPKAKAFKATVVAPQKITVREAYRVFLAVLQANGLTVLPSGDVWKIVESQDVARQVTPVTGPSERPTTEERYVTHLHRLEHVGAEEVASTILSKLQTHDASVVAYAPGNLLILTETGENIARMLKILEQIDVAAAGDKVYLQPLHYASAADVVKRLDEILALKGGDGKGGAGGAGVGEARVTRLVALERPNALAIVAGDAAYRRVLKLLDALDVPPSNEGEIHVVALQHADAKRIVGPLSEALGGAAGSARGAGTAGLEGSVKISAEESTNSILVTASPRDFLAVERVVRALDQKRRQVFIEAVVLDLSMEHGESLGVALHGGAPASALGGDALAYGGSAVQRSLGAPASLLATTDPSMQALALGVRGPALSLPGISIPSFGALITAAVTDKRADILSTPNILASDNTPAEIRVQTNTALQRNVPAFPTLPVAPGAGAGANPLAGLAGLAALGSGAFGGGAGAFGKIGPRIKVTPHLNDSDEVRLDVEESISDLLDEGPQGTTGSISYMERAATTTLTVKDQETVVIGGLVRNKHVRSETKVPFLGDIPVLGALFRSRADRIEKANLVLVLTPYIIRDASDLRRIFERKMQERQEFLDHHIVFGDASHGFPRAFARRGGLLWAIRQATLEIAERRRLEAPSSPREVKGHDPVQPVELPGPAARPPPPSPPASPPGARALSRVES